MADDSSSSSSSPPAKAPSSGAGIDRSSLERVLARAAELQSSSGDAEEAFTEEQLLELGREVGLSAQSLRQALAEERTRSIVPNQERGFSASVFGPGRVRASRVVPGRATAVLAAIDEWMQREELLIVKRHHSDRIVWEPRQDFLVGIKRALRVGGRDYTLSHAFEAAATVVPIDEKQVQVAVDADFRNQRARVIRQILGSSVAGGVITASLAVISVPLLLSAAPVVVASLGGIAGARALHNRVLTRAQLALEQLLDRLERDDLRSRSPDSLLGAIVAAATARPPRRY